MDPGCKAELKRKLGALTFNLGLAFTPHRRGSLLSSLDFKHVCEEEGGRLCI